MEEFPHAVVAMAHRWTAPPNISNGSLTRSIVLSTHVSYSKGQPIASRFMIEFRGEVKVSKSPGATPRSGGAPGKCYRRQHGSARRFVYTSKHHQILITATHKWFRISRGSVHKLVSAIMIRDGATQGAVSAPQSAQSLAPLMALPFSAALLTALPSRRQRSS